MEEHKGLGWQEIAFIALIGVLLLLNWAGVFTHVLGVNTALILTLVGGYRIFWDALDHLRRLRIGGDLAVAIACGAALAIGENLVAAQVIFIMLVGGALETYAVGRTGAAIEKLARLLPDTVAVRREDREERISLAEVRAGDTVLVRPGERVPVDGVVLTGHSAVNQASLTGESLPTEKAPGDEVYTGTLAESGYLEIQATGVGEETQLARIIRLVREAQAEKAPIERVADRYAGYFVPAILVLSASVYLITQDVVRAIATLIVVCPCAFVLATPTAVVAAMGRLARRGILVKGGPALEAAGRANCVVFDKTGTLTKGQLRVAEVVPLPGYTEAQVLSLAASAERGSGHLIANVIVAEAERRSVPFAWAESFHDFPGRGVAAQRNGQRIVVGNQSLMKEEGIPIDGAANLLAGAQAQGRNAVLVAASGSLAGVITVEDEVRPESAEVVTALRRMGIAHIQLLTGDAEPVARKVASQVGIQERHAGLAPDGKAAALRRLKEEGYTVVMLGDGVNDAPSLALADVGVTLGGIGTDVALEAANIVFMNDDLRRLPETIAVSRRMASTVGVNIAAFAIGMNVLSSALTSTGVFGPTAAAVMHQIASLLVVGNSLRLLIPGKDPLRPRGSVPS